MLYFNKNSWLRKRIWTHYHTNELLKRRTFLVILHFVKHEFRGFPSGSVVKNLPANAGDTGSIPGLGRSHMPLRNKACTPQLLSLEPRSHNYWAHTPHQQEKPLPRESYALQLERSPHWPQLEKACSHQGRPNAANKKQLKKKYHHNGS